MCARLDGSPRPLCQAPTIPRQATSREDQRGTNGSLGSAQRPATRTALRQPVMALARVVLAALLCFSVASARDILQDAAADTALISGEGILPVMPAMNMLTGAAAAHHQAALAPDPPLPNAASGPNGVNRVLKPAAFMPGNAASNASVAMGFLVAPLMMQRGPMRARFNAPVLPDTVPAELAGLPPGVQRALGFTITQAPKPGACGGSRQQLVRQLTPPCAQAARPAASPRWPRTTTRSPASSRAAEPWGSFSRRRPSHALRRRVCCNPVIPVSTPNWRLTPAAPWQ